jgi:hypothetical protein
MGVVGEFVMAAGLHEDAKARVGLLAVGRDVDEVLQHHVIKQVTFHRPVVAAGEVLAETVAIKTAGAGLGAEDATDEVDLTIVGEQVHHLVIEALVEVVPVFELQVADGLRVLQLPTWAASSPTFFRARGIGHQWPWRTFLIEERVGLNGSAVERPPIELFSGGLAGWGLGVGDQGPVTLLPVGRSASASGPFLS